ncbi:uncharacterized protein LOC114261446 [Camellia sinensis]|uniref:uncharacterized protein LOC114261446 n=1 Tax=Camellia sinensis TaxID=4442 RepID=UPI001036CAA4|nr:uncharacterized protein LOC114261446 [Camellia sinensis]
MSSPLFFLSFSSSRSHSLAAPTTLALVLPLCFPLLCSSSLLFFSLPPSRSPSLTVPTALAVALPFFLFFFSLCLPAAAFVEDVHTYLSQLGLDVNSALSFLQERLQQYRLVEIKLLAQQRAQASAIQWTEGMRGEKHEGAYIIS